MGNKNNSQYFIRIIKHLKTFKKFHSPNNSHIPYKSTYDLIPLPIRQYNKCAASMSIISIMPINSSPLQMILTLFMTLLSTTGIF